MIASSPVLRPARWLALWLVLFMTGAHAAQPDGQPPGVIVATVRSSPFSDPVEAIGTLTANESVELTATVTETVSAIHFDDGDRVEQGQVLVEMTSREEHAQLEEARATLNEARRQYQRIRSLEAEGTAAKAQLDERQREMKTAAARLAAIESRLVDRLLKAPFAGVVGLRDLSVGALVQPGDRVTTLDDDSVMKLEFPLPEILLADLRPGQDVTARTRAFPDREFSATVRSVDSRIDPVTRSVRVRALLPNPEHSLRPGQLMQVILLRHPRTALTIPEEALQPLGDRQSVLVLRADDTVEQRAITTGTRHPGQVEVLTGLSAGERVITHGMNVRAGQSVRVIAEDDGSRSLPELLRALPGGKAGE